MILGCGNVSEVILAPASAQSQNTSMSIKPLHKRCFLDSLSQWSVSASLWHPLRSLWASSPLLFSLAILALGGLLGALSESFEILVLARVLQGLGNASIILIVVTIINDSYERSDAVRVLATISGIMMIACLQLCLWQLDH